MRTAAIIVAAGKGERAGGDVPKQLQPLGGVPMLSHSYRALMEHAAIDEVIVVIGAGQDGAARAAIGDATMVTGGGTRRQSVFSGLSSLAADPPDRVLIHDAARPFLSDPVIDRLLAALDTRLGAVPVLPMVDTLAHGTDILGMTVPRDELFRVQTPQAFAYEAILGAHEVWDGPEPTDDAQMVRALGGSVALVQGDPMLEKITHPKDFVAAEARLGAEWRTATGFDVHRLEAGEELWLGGVLIPHDKGLSGHSDADVALHALTDALLGTIAAGDIGTHFPPSDPQWKGAASHRFLAHAADLIAAKGGTITFVDLTLMCEAPRIGPYRAAMQARIAELLAFTPDRVSIKATTTERLGFTGRGEGIACQASATVRLPGTLA